MKPHLLIFGAGGHARAVISIARCLGDWELAGVLAKETPSAPERIDDVPVIGAYGDAGRLYSQGWGHAAIAIGENAERARWQAELARVGFSFPVLRHPTAYVEYNAIVGEGCVIGAGAVIGAQARLGRGVIVNTGTIVDHETQVGDHAHLAPGCRVAGRVCIGAGVMIGIGSSVRDKISIGEGSVLGAGSVVVDDIPPKVLAYGVPARVARPLAS